ncbi:hypothetical protein OJF2_59190 [Aquisphaera giovannonii]|uniref:GHMP kinase C-terminal domain-containing protein n=1 Tax=Aquisphaera giovannonii TaxID=406548 RepID=A0A5B9WAQ9_9BACT|nr:beta-ribofuranosylaminobenzene 5'-phosphate synthase family protein [Aquisphaera giovannonii]QEH37329.1 hypothetical protein OJF2_59190 [Aquisphaera giovannonii]
MNRPEIRTPGRLHFGLLGWGPDAPRQFGGVGLMVESGGIRIAGERAPEWSAAGPLASRVLAILREIRQLAAIASHPLASAAPCHVEVLEASPEHVGLGVGTQLSLAVLRLMLELEGLPPADAPEMARLTGRGRRSGIGLHGFLHGGLIVDGGRASRADAGPPPLVARVAFPEDWSILLIRPPGPQGRHGAEERSAFSELPPLPYRTTDRLCRLVLLGLVPAVLERDLAAFGEALSDLQREVGRAFAPSQGGTYASPQAEAIVEELGRIGLVGAGQTSWGPTLYAFGRLGERDRERIGSSLRLGFQLSPSAVSWTTAANRGAAIAG